MPGDAAQSAKRQREEEPSTELLPLETFMRRVTSLRAAFAKRARSLRGVPASELQQRLERAQALMDKAELDCLLVTTEQDFFYFTGLASRFWNSPTRPFFLLIPREGLRPIAVIPSIMGETIACHTWLEPADVHTWAAPHPPDDGVTLLAHTIASLPRKFSKAGFMMGLESVMRMPLTSVDRVRGLLSQSGIMVADGSPVVRSLRLLKSDFEVARVKHACAIASAAFELFPLRLEALRRTKLVTEEATSLSERDARDALRMMMIELGADDTAYVMAQSGKGGYDNIVLEPTDMPLVPGDVLVIDTGIQFESCAASSRPSGPCDTTLPAPAICPDFHSPPRQVLVRL